MGVEIDCMLDSKKKRLAGMRRPQVSGSVYVGGVFAAVSVRGSFREGMALAP